ncbi:MAG TPA: ATP-binding protein [Blastocatellia bacterium]|nr:ATP-binding protein [Blastocatellia bacterium]
MFNSVRTRLTLWYVSVLAVVLVASSITLYALVSRALYENMDNDLHSLLEVTARSFENDLKEDKSDQIAAQSTTAEMSQSIQSLRIFDINRRLLGGNHPDVDLRSKLPDFNSIPADDIFVTTVAEDDDAGEYHRVMLRRVTVPPANTPYIIVASQSLEDLEKELKAIRDPLLYVGPLALLLAGIGGWLLARKSLAPVVTMAESARRIGAENLGQQLPIANPHDELGQLATVFNELLARLNDAFSKQQRANEQQRQFMADASHELRTPLMLINTAAGVTLRKDDRPRDEYRETIKVMDKEAQRLAQIVKDMFVLSRADAEQYPLQKRTLYLNDLLEEVARTSDLLAVEKGVKLVVTKPPEANFYGDEDLLRRMLLNLVDNAIRHTPAGGVIQLNLEQKTNNYVFSISDTGSGIPADAQAHIFERFYRVDKARARAEALSGGGAGLGLSIALWIAQVHGGSLSLANSNSNGTTFVAQLPLDRLASPS